MGRVLLPLDDTVVLWLPPQDGEAHIPSTSKPRVVQVRLKAEDAKSVETITTYYLVRHDLSDLIMRIVAAHFEHPLPESMVFEGSRYTIHAKRSKWEFGNRLRFLWGYEELESCEDKWTFRFAVRSSG